MTLSNIGMKIIETEKELSSFLDHYRSESEVYVDAVPANQTIHPRRSGISFVFVRTSEREALLPVRHNDAKALNPKDLLKLNTGARKLTLNKKRVLHLVPISGLVDCRLLQWFRTNRRTEFKPNKIYPKAKNIYRPITRLAERCQRRLDLCENIAQENRRVLNTSPFQKYNEDIIETLFRVERNGMYADPEDFKLGFEKDLTDKENLSYSNYNVLTQTGRPSNTYKGVNYAALDGEERLAFQSRFERGKLVSIDYDAFHLRIISKLIGYDAPKGSFHRHLAKLYFGESDISDEEYKEAKKFTFQFLYNPKGIPDELLQLDFFQGVKEFTEQVWSIYQKHGVIQTPLHGRQITGSAIENFNPAKATNYLLQSGSAEIACAQIKKLLDYLSDKNTCVCLYLYDSVLVDYDRSDSSSIQKIKDIMETEDLTTNVEMGERFGKLEEIHIGESERQ